MSFFPSLVVALAQRRVVDSLLRNVIFAGALTVPSGALRVAVVNALTLIALALHHTVWPYRRRCENALESVLLVVVAFAVAVGARCVGCFVVAPTSRHPLRSSDASVDLEAAPDVAAVAIVALAVLGVALQLVLPRLERRFPRWRL